MSHPAVLTEHVAALDVGAIADLSAPELACILDDLAEQKAALQRIDDKLRLALDLKYGIRTCQRRAEAAKDTGAVRFVDNGFVILAEMPKQVTWDQAKLQAACEIIRTSWGDDPADYVKFKLEISESDFASWPRPVRELFLPARKVETLPNSYRIESLARATREAA
jgi:hypothetical protein